jgi:hypothetical protein
MGSSGLCYHPPPACREPSRPQHDEGETAEPARPQAAEGVMTGRIGMGITFIEPPAELLAHVGT